MAPVSACCVTYLCLVCGKSGEKEKKKSGAKNTSTANIFLVTSPVFARICQLMNVISKSDKFVLAYRKRAPASTATRTRTQTTSPPSLRPYRLKSNALLPIQVSSLLPVRYRSLCLAHQENSHRPQATSQGGRNCSTGSMSLSYSHPSHADLYNSASRCPF